MGLLRCLGARSDCGIPNGIFPHVEALLLCQLEYCAHEQGKPSFNLLQNFRSSKSHIMFYAFDVLVSRSDDLTKQTLTKRREILESTVKANEYVGVSHVSHQTANELLNFVKKHGLEGSSRSEQTASMSRDGEAGSGSSIASISVRSSGSGATCPAI